MTKNNLTLRPMQESELGSWQELSQQDYIRDLMDNYGYHQQEAEKEAAAVQITALHQGFNTPCHHFRIIQSDNHPIGYLWFTLENHSAFLMDLLLDVSCQGKGNGRQIISLLVEELKSMEASELELRVAPDNLRARRLYEKCLFRVTGINMHLKI